MKFVKTIFGILDIAAAIVLVGTAVLMFMTAFSPSNRVRVLRVMSGSMEPALRTGSVVLSVRSDISSLKPGDIIAFAGANEPGKTVTHRINSIVNANGKTVIRTKGDANRDVDIDPVDPSLIQGKVVWSAPFLGYMAAFVKTPAGFILFVILPALLIVISEIWNIRKTLEEWARDKYGQNDLTENT